MIDWLEGAIRNPKQDGGSHLAPILKLCLHSTESGSLPGYPGTAPDFTIDVRRRLWYQHSPTSRAGRALMHPGGTVETNRGGVVQIEIIGSCDRGFASKWGYLYVPEMTVQEIAWLGGVLGYICRTYGIPIQCTVPWKRYAASAGPNNGVRLNNAQWQAYRGWLGHQHAPGNDHGDAGDLPIAALLAAAGAPTMKEILDMNLSDPIESRLPGDVDRATGKGKIVSVANLLQNIQIRSDDAAVSGAALLRGQAEALLLARGYGTRTEQIQGEVDRLVAAAATPDLPTKGA